MNICFSGLTASGKSYQAKKIAEKLGFDYINAASLLLEEVYKDEYRKTYDQTDIYWFSESNVSFLKDKRNEKNLDLIIDNKLIELAKENNKIVFDCRVLPWLYKGSELLKIYLNPPVEDRYKICFLSRDEHSYSIEDIKRNLDKKD